MICATAVPPGYAEMIEKQIGSKSLFIYYRNCTGKKKGSVLVLAFGLIPKSVRIRGIIGIPLQVAAN